MNTPHAFVAKDACHHLLKSVGPESFEEERWLMYVAVTRARNRLLIAYPVDGLPGSPQRPSPFLTPKYPWDDLSH